jgi:membrane-associated phospholipid phosphatase
MTDNSESNKAVATIAQVDRKAADVVGAKRDTSPLKLIGLLAEIGDQPQMIAIAGGTLASGLLGRRPEVARAGARMLLAHLVATGVKTAIKHQFDRRRPAAAEESGDDHFRKGSSHEHEENSFPSGHTAGAVAVARAVARDIDGAAGPAALGAAAIAAAQPATGSHFVSDVLAGAAIGWVSELAVSAIFDRAEPAVVSVRDRFAGIGDEGRLASH